MREEGLLDRAIIYAPTSMRRAAVAASGVFTLSRLGGSPRITVARRPWLVVRLLSCGADRRVGSAAGDSVIMDAGLRRKITFSDHSLATDNVFSEIHLITCRNVLIYFDHALQNRALRLFSESLVHGGFLGLGSKESLRFTEASHLFNQVAQAERIYRRVGRGS